MADSNLQQLTGDSNSTNSQSTHGKISSPNEYEEVKNQRVHLIHIISSEANIEIEEN